MKVKFQKTIKKKERFLPAKKKYCRFCADKVEVLDYKDVKKLEMFIRERGKIVPSRVTGNCAKHQRRLVEALKQSRFISLMPYTRV
jgi:small subunit ribosomal protein S18